MEAYTPEIERVMKGLYDSPGDKDCRRYAAVDATKSGHGGIESIARVLGCDPQDHPPRTVGTGGEGRPAQREHSKNGGGRKPSIEIDLTLNENFLKVLHDHTAAARVGQANAIATMATAHPTELRMHQTKRASSLRSACSAKPRPSQ